MWENACVGKKVHTEGEGVRGGEGGRVHTEGRVHQAGLSMDGEWVVQQNKMSDKTYLVLYIAFIPMPLAWITAFGLIHGSIYPPCTAWMRID